MAPAPSNKGGRAAGAPPKKDVKANAFDLMDDPNVPMLADDEPPEEDDQE